MAIVISLVTILILWPLPEAQFITFDDGEYVVANEWVTGGITTRSLRWALSAFHAANWHPVTWLSHMIDVELFGLNPSGHHLMNLLIHGANAGLLFVFLTAATGAFWRSAVVALLFGVHPLHVESVAWISERKDLLAGLFGILTLMAYLAYTRRSSLLRYFRVTIVFAVGLAAKPVLVTLPFVMLLLDYWPLERYLPPPGKDRKLAWLPLVFEKTPLFFLSAVSSLLTLKAQSGAVAPSLLLPFNVRTANALLSYVKYLGKTFWPSGLIIYYPHSGKLPPIGLLLFAAAVLAAISLAVILLRRYKYLGVGWCWFLGMLVPMIGLVQVGNQAMADRYTYLPLIGVFMALTWGIGDLFHAIPLSFRRGAAAAVAVTVFIPLFIGARIQTRYWHDSHTLFTRVIQVTPENWMAYAQLGNDSLEKGDCEKGLMYLNTAVRINPYYLDGIMKLGMTYHHLGRSKEALPFLQTLVTAPLPGQHWLNNIGVALMILGREEEAIDKFRTAVSLLPYESNPRFNLGKALLKTGKSQEGIGVLRKLIVMLPSNKEAHLTLASALAEEGLTTEAVTNYRAALALDPGDPQILLSLANVLSGQGQFEEAIALYRHALSFSPSSPEIHNNLGVALADSGRLQEAVREFQQSLAIDPTYQDAQVNLGLAEKKMNGERR